MLKKIGLVPRLLLGIISGILIGMFLPETVSRLLYTFTHIFGEFLNYIVPFVILAFIIPGIAELGNKASYPHHFTTFYHAASLNEIKLCKQSFKG
ncbi:Sodium:dicarboxylate symporter family protein [Halanaerobium congolense]|nr:cation:dicarboxylase symporter family transporter [Halanaerobium congolense]SHM62965.1 Sodium:dicarboxylate symporter family protein [Halanaerobium congolense]